MTNPTPLSHAGAYDRWTLQNLRDFAMFAAGGRWADLNATEQGLLDKLINAAHAQRRRLVRNARRFAEESVTLAWVDGDDSIALPANLSEVIGRHLWIVDANDKPLEHPIEIIREEEFLDGFFPQGADAPGSPLSRWDGKERPIARIFREESGTHKRILHVYPRPKGGTRIRVLYLSETNALVNAGDLLEAPTAYNYIVALDAAIEWLSARGPDDKVPLLLANRQRWESELVGARETDRPTRARFYDEVGYPSTRQGEPQKALFSLPR